MKRTHLAGVAAVAAATVVAAGLPPGAARASEPLRGAARASEPLRGAAHASEPPRAQLVRFSCRRALDPVRRSVSVQAVMRPLAGTRRLAIRFDLLERTPGAGPVTAVQANGLGVWINPTDATLGRLPGDVWRLNKPVVNLDAPARYRFRVRFRWTAAQGRVLGSAVRFSRWCRQRELRPDLLVQSIAVRTLPDHPDEQRYVAVIANRGASRAGPFEVLFAPGEPGAAIARVVPSLGTHRSRRIAFVGPPCNPAAPPTVTVDAAGQVDDYDRSNNTLSTACPGAPAGGATLDSAER